MALNSSGFTKSVELAVAKTPQQIEKPGVVPGAENPQTSAAIIKAKKGNTGALFIGFSKAELEPEGEGFELAAGESVAIDLNGLGGMWFTGANAKDKLVLLGVGP